MTNYLPDHMDNPNDLGPLALVSSDVLGAWRPIATAPKDGTEVLVLLECAGVAVVHIAWYRSREEWESSGQYCGGWDTLEEWEGWWSYTRNSVGQDKLEGYATPTHWHPKLTHSEAPKAEFSGPPRR
jgi:hypothetical protein